MIGLSPSPRRLWIPFATLIAALVLIVLPMQDLIKEVYAGLGIAGSYLLGIGNAGQD